MADAARKHRWKARLWIMQMGRCWICEQDIANIREATIDHVIPRPCKGRNQFNHIVGNILLAHRKCNSERGNSPPMPFEKAFAEAIYYKAREIPLEDIKPLYNQSRYGTF